jgi:uncharacterized protein (DUF58 family)
MQTLIPEPVSHQAHPKGRRLGRLLGFGLTRRALLLLAAATLLSVPAFLQGKTPWLMFGVDALLLIAALAEASTLPAPEVFTLTRRFLHAPEVGHPVQVELTAVHTARGLYALWLTDDLHPSMVTMPRAFRVTSYPNDPATVTFSVEPSMRGDVALGKLYLRYRGALGLTERWAVADLRQTARVYAAGEQAGGALYLMRARQIELEKRRLRQIGLGREFETMRDYQPGDEMRSISWKSTARHNRLITQQYTTERSQQVWIVLDAGRLSQTAYRLGNRTASHAGTKQSRNSFADRIAGNDDAVRVVTQLDQAASAAGLLARVVVESGDKCALLTYGRRVQQQLLPGAGAAHLRRVIDALSQVKSESAEADHMLASARLRQLQRRRGLVLWITEMTESAGRPEIVAAVTELVRRHLVVLVLLRHPELQELAEAAPADARSMYAGAAAQEMLERRRVTLAQLRAQGVLIVETSASEVATDAISEYLEVKSQGRL